MDPGWGKEVGDGRWEKSEEGEAQSVLRGLWEAEGSVQMVDLRRMRERDKLCLSHISGFPSAHTSGPDLSTGAHLLCFAPSDSLRYLVIVFIVCSSSLECEP